MTYAPSRLLEVRAYLQPRTGLPAVSLGIVGSAGHHATGTSYHIGWSSLRSNAYSRQLTRDTTLRTDAASALDVGHFNRSGKTLVGLTAWMVAEARAGRRPDTREIIGPHSDGRAYRWAHENQWAGQLRARGDSHETHVHESYYRDSESRDKVRFFRGYFEPGTPPIEEDDVSAEDVWNHRIPRRELTRGDWPHLSATVRAQTVTDAIYRFSRWARDYSLAARRGTERIEEQQQAILAAVAGDNLDTIVAKLDAHHAEKMAALEQQGGALDALSDLLESLPDAVAAELGDRDSDAVAAAVERVLGRLRVSVDGE